MRGLPRFNFCGFADGKCLTSLEKSKAVVDGRKPPVFVVLMRAKGGYRLGSLRRRRRLLGARGVALILRTRKKKFPKKKRRSRMRMISL